jgi:hypothetical protein
MIDDYKLLPPLSYPPVTAGRHKLPPLFYPVSKEGTAYKVCVIYHGRIYPLTCGPPYTVDKDGWVTWDSTLVEGDGFSGFLSEREAEQLMIWLRDAGWNKGIDYTYRASPVSYQQGLGQYEVANMMDTGPFHVCLFKRFKFL